MRSLISFIAVLFFCAPSWSQLRQGEVPEELEDKYYEILSGLTFERDRIVRKYAVVMHGETVATGDHLDGVVQYPIVMLRVVDRSRQYDHRAKYVVRGGSESGTEVLKDGKVSTITLN